MKKDIEFLINLQKELNTQDNEYNYDPVYWSIMDYKEIAGNEDYDDGDYHYFYNDGNYTRFKTKKELFEFINEFSPEDLESDWHVNNLKNYLQDEKVCLGEFFEYVKYYNKGLHGCDDYDSIFMKEESYIVPNTMFITKKEAEEHLKLNYYNYSSKAHLFSMSACRSEEVSELWKILKEFDWSKIVFSDIDYDDGGLYAIPPTQEEYENIQETMKFIKLATMKKNNEKLLKTVEKLSSMINELDIELCTVLSNNDIQVTGNLTGERYEEIMEYISRIEKDLETQEYIKNMVEKERNQQNETKRKNAES